MTDRKGSVLLVEDEPGLVRTLTDRLKAEGYDVLATGDGRQAISAIEAGGADLILLDVMLPGADGFAVLCDVRNRGIRTGDHAVSAGRGRRRRQTRRR
jgi:two-component system response regulator RegX3